MIALTTLPLPHTAMIPTLPTVDDTTDLHQWSEHRDEAALQRLIVRHTGMVHGVCRRRLGDGAAADEAAQAVFIALSRAPVRIVRAGGLGGWLHQVALNACRQVQRSAARRSRHEHVAAQRWLQENQASGGPPPEWSNVRPLLDEALGDLDGGQRAAVVGHFLEGMSQGDVAAQLGVSENAVQKRINVALERLRGWFGKRGMALPVTVLTAGLASECLACPPAVVVACTHAAMQPELVPGAHALSSSLGGWGLAHGVAAACLVAAIVGITTIAGAWHREGLQTSPENVAAQQAPPPQVGGNPPPAPPPKDTVSLAKFLNFNAAIARHLVHQGNIVVPAEMQELLGLDDAVTKSVEAELATLSTRYEMILAKHPPIVERGVPGQVTLRFRGIQEPVRELVLSTGRLFTDMVAAKRLTPTQAQLLRKHADAMIWVVVTSINGSEMGDGLQGMTIVLTAASDAKKPGELRSIAISYEPADHPAGKMQEGESGGDCTEAAWFYLPFAGLPRSPITPLPARNIPGRAGDPDQVPLATVMRLIDQEVFGGTVGGFSPQAGSEWLGLDHGRVRFGQEARDLGGFTEPQVHAIEQSLTAVYNTYRSAIAADPPIVSTTGPASATLKFNYIGGPERFVVQEDQALADLVRRGILSPTQVAFTQTISRSDRTMRYKCADAGTLSLTFAPAKDFPENAWMHAWNHSGGESSNGMPALLNERFRFALSYVAFAQGEALPPIQPPAPAHEASSPSRTRSMKEPMTTPSVPSSEESQSPLTHPD